MILCARSRDPGCARAPGSGTSSGGRGTGCRVCAQGKPVETRRNPTHWSGEVLASLDPAGPSYSWWCWNRCCVLLTPDPKILGMLEHLGVEPPLGAVGLATVLEPKVSRCRPEGMFNHSV